MNPIIEMVLAGIGLCFSAIIILYSIFNLYDSLSNLFKRVKSLEDQVHRLFRVIDGDKFYVYNPGGSGKYVKLVHEEVK